MRLGFEPWSLGCLRPSQNKARWGQASLLLSFPNADFIYVGPDRSQPILLHSAQAEWGSILTACDL